MSGGGDERTLEALEADALRWPLVVHIAEHVDVEAAHTHERVNNPCRSYGHARKLDK